MVKGFMLKLLVPNIQPNLYSTSSVTIVYGLKTVGSHHTYITIGLYKPLETYNPDQQPSFASGENQDLLSKHQQPHQSLLSKITQENLTHKIMNKG